MVLVPDQKELRNPDKSRRTKAGLGNLDDYVAGDSPFKRTDKKVNAKKGTKVEKVRIGPGRNPNANKRGTGNRKR